MFIKIIVLLAVCASALSLHARGQGTNEFTLSAGFFSRYRLQNLQAGIGPLRSASGDIYKRRDISGSGAYFLTFQRALVREFILGFALGIEQERGSFNDEYGQHQGTYRKRSLSFAVEGRYAYFSRGRLGLYMMIGVGPHFYQQTTASSQLYNGVPVTTETAEEMSIGPGYQISPVGVRYGKQFGGFAELGYGYKGILNLGASYRF